MSDTGEYSESFQRRKKIEHESKPPHEGTLALIRAISAVVPKSDSIIDLGAGTGRHVRMLREEGYNCIGVDGTPRISDITDGLVIERNLLESPLRSPLLHPLGDSDFLCIWDWGLFYDVGEHVPRKHEQKLIDNICKIPRKGLIVSWGYPGERGRGHVNCRTQVYIACEFAKRGFWPDDRLTTVARDASSFWTKHHIRLFVAKRMEKSI